MLSVIIYDLVFPKHGTQIAYRRTALSEQFIGPASIIITDMVLRINTNEH